MNRTSVSAGDTNDNKTAVGPEDVSKMGCPILGEHTKLEVVIEESYEFKVTSLVRINNLARHSLYRAKVSAFWSCWCDERDLLCCFAGFENPIATSCTWRSKYVTPTCVCVELFPAMTAVSSLNVRQGGRWSE